MLTYGESPLMAVFQLWHRNRIVGNLGVITVTANEISLASLGV